MTQSPPSSVMQAAASPGLGTGRQVHAASVYTLMEGVNTVENFNVFFQDTRKRGGMLLSPVIIEHWSWKTIVSSDETFHICI